MRSQSRKPPLGNWQPTVPAWEKKFCWEVGRVPWRKLLETKKLIHVYDNMLKWDDSASKEAFHNAKARYWAGLNGLPCDIPLPNPNAYIDDVDWSSDVDPELILDLDRDFVVSNDLSEGGRVLNIGEVYAKSQGLTADGWGEEDDGCVKLTEWYLEKIRHPYADVAAEGIDHGGQWEPWNLWENKVLENRDGGKNEWNCGSGWKQWDNGVNRIDYNWDDDDAGYNSNYKESSGGYMLRYKFGNHPNRNNNGRYNGRESSGRYTSRYKMTRFYGDHQLNDHWERRNRNGRKR